MNYNIIYYNLFIIIIMISLGGNCAVAYQLQKYNKRNKSLPFDWCSIKLNQLNKVLSNDFKNYNNFTIYKKSTKHLKNNQESYILKNDYNINFAHEIINKYDIKTFKNIMTIRIDKFRKLINPTFIRLEINNLSSKQMIKYKDLIKNLDKYFCNYNIILITKNDLPFTDKKIKIFKLNSFSSDWKYNNFNWQDLFII